MATISLSEKILVAHYRQLKAPERCLLYMLRAGRSRPLVLIFAKRSQRLKRIAKLAVSNFGD